MSSKLKPPIILIGNVRSGTTMLQRLFSMHPSLCTWLEPKPIWNYADPGRKYDRMDENDATDRVRRFIRNRFEKYQEENGGKQIMEKTPSNIVRIPYVHAIFPESKFLYVIRNPLSQISSSEYKWQNVIDWKDRKWAFYRIKQTPKSQIIFYAGTFFKEFINKKFIKKKHAHVFGIKYPNIHFDINNFSTEEIIAKQWVYCSQQAEKDLNRLNPSKVFKIKYETFVENPLFHFTRILDHFDLDITSQIKTIINNIVDPSRQNKWKRLDPEIINKCILILQSEMEKQGYEIPKNYIS